MTMKKVIGFLGVACRRIYMVGRDDPRRVIHSLKVGLSLTLVSLLYLLEPLFDGIGQNSIWAVLTVVVVLEFSAGATLCKGLNRGLGTLLAGSLAFLMEYIATESGRIFRAVFIGVAVFVIGSASTYTRFFPHIKKNYDYGVVVFLLTFNMITVSSYRVDNVLKIAQERFYTIAIGCGICLLMSLLMFPNWSGEDLHNSTVLKLEGLAKSIQDCVYEYFNGDESTELAQDKSLEDPIYKAVLDSKSIDETLATQASWEPRHLGRCQSSPWKQYVKLGGVIRHFGYTVVALHGCLQTEIQTPPSVRALFKDPCCKLSEEVSKVLMQLADSVRNRRECCLETPSEQLHQALQELNAAFKSQPRLFLGHNSSKDNMVNVTSGWFAHKSYKSFKDSFPSSKTGSPDSTGDWRSKKSFERSKEEGRKVLRPMLSKIAITSLEFSEVLPFAAFASLLVETVARLDLVILEVEELGRIARFREFAPNNEVIVTCEKPKIENVGTKQNLLPSYGD